jgi:microcystin synthetase protein McyG
MITQVRERIGRPNEMAWSDGGDLTIPAGAPPTLTEAFLGTASEHGDRGILHVQADGSTELQRYADLLIAAKRVLSGLRASGLGPRDQVILQLDDLRDHFAGFWACVLGGFVPLTIALPHTDDRTHAIVKKLVDAWQLLDRPLILTQERTRDLLARILHGAGAGGDASAPARITTIEPFRNAPPATDLHTSAPDDLVFLQLTSGSTGVAKCIQETHRGVVSHIHSVTRFNGYEENDITLNWLSMDHVAPILMCHLKDVYLGCRQIHTKPEVILANPLTWLDLIEAHRVTHTWSPNFGYKLVCDRLANAPPRTRDLSSVKLFFNAGEQVTWPVVREFCDRIATFGAPARTMQPGFGMAETATAVVYQNQFDPERSVYRIAKASLGGALRSAPDGDGSAVTFIDLGPPIPGVQLRIIDTEDRLLPEGVVGRVQIKGAVVTPGYYRNDEANRAAFVGDGWFDSGDLGFLAQRRLCVTGRAKEMIITRGTHYACSEIEDVVTEVRGVLPTFVAACSIADPAIGSDGLAIFFVPRSPEAGPGAEDEVAIIRAIRSAVAVKLGIAPAAVVPLAREAFPKTTSGKIQRAQLKEWLEAGRYDEVLRALERAREAGADRSPRPAPSDETGARPPGDGPGVAAPAHTGYPRSHVEDILTEAWKQALSVPRVGLHDNFFELGGHSLAMREVQGRLQAALGREISSVELFRYPTVASLAGFLCTGAPQDGVVSLDETRRGAHAEDVAIVGMAGRFPKAKNAAEFWRNLVDGVACTTTFTDEEMEEAGVDPQLLRSPGYVKTAPVLDDVELFAAPFFGYAPREAEAMDPQQRLFLELSWEALEDAGYAPGTFAGSVGVFGGVTFNTYAHFLQRRPGLDMEFVSDLVGMDKDFLTTRVSYKLDLKGPSVNVQTACSTSLVAVHLACQSLLHGDADMALAGAVSIRVPHKAGHLHQEGGIFSVDGLCRAFDASASGMMFGNGGGVLVLKRLSHALRDRDTIHAVIKGSAINNDGALKAGFTAPSVDGQVKVLRAAMANGSVAPKTISYVEAHGTGTSLGDPIEFAALCEAFDQGARRTAPCALGSVKTNIGHLDAAAGIAGLMKTVLMLGRRQLVPTLHFEAPNPEIALAESPFTMSTTLSPWPAGATPRRAGVSAFGFGGTNAHVVLEEAPVRDAPGPRTAAQLLVLSAKTASALARARVDLASHLRLHPELELADVAYTLHLGRQTFDHRCTVVCRDTNEAARALDDARSDRVVTARSGAERPRIGFVLGGDPAQLGRAGAELYREDAAFASAVDRCYALLERPLGLDLRPDRYLDAAAALAAGTTPERADVADAASFVTIYALAQWWMGWGVAPMATAGAGVGEVAAACLAGVVSLEEALALVVRRARLRAGLDVRAGGAVLENIAPRPPRLPVLSGVTGRWMADEEATDLRAWVDRAPQPSLPDGGRDALRAAGLVVLEVLPITPSPPPDGHSVRATLLDTLGRLHLANVPVDWTAFYAGGGRGRVPLPTYPFERQRYWIDMRSTAPPHPARIGKRADLGTWTYVPSWRRAPEARHAAAEEATAPRRWLILCDEAGLGLRLAQELTRSGHPVVTVDAGAGYGRTGERAYTIDPRNPSDYATLLEALGAEVPEQVVHLWSVSEAAATASVSEIMSRGFHSLVYLAQAMAARDWTHPIHMTVVGSEAQDVLGDEPIVPAKATLLAPVIGIPQEHRNISCRYLDVEPASRAATSSAPLADRIIAEALAADPDHVVAYRGRHRWVQRYEPFPLPSSAAAPSGLRHRGVYLITGGLGSIGLVLAEHLAARYQAKLILTSRGCDDHAEAEATARKIRQLEALGGEVMVAAADVADAEQMRAVMRRIEAHFGQLHGVIHAAGLLKGDAFPTISTCTPVHWEAQLRPKVSGTLVLAEVLPEGLDFCVVFSSLASALGGLGLCPYAAANLFLDGFVQHRARGRQPDEAPWLSVNWDYWQTAPAAPRKEALGSLLFRATDTARAELGITPEEGIEMFERVVSLHRSAVPQILVATGDLDARIARWVHRTPPREPSTSPKLPARAPHARPSLAAPHVAPRDETEAAIARIWQDLLGTAGVGVDDDFFALGGDSLHAIRIAARLRAALGTELAVHELFEAPTVAQLAERLRQRNAEAARSALAGTDLHRPAAAPRTLHAHQFAVPATATGDDKKRHMRQFYDAITDQLDASELGPLSVFLNLGYVADESRRYSTIRVPDHLINVSSIRLVHEVIGDCALGADSEILDIGCGRGGTISQIHEHFAVKQVTGLDLSTSAIAFCRDQHRRPDTRFVEGNAEALPFPDQSFDVAINIESSHSYPDLQAFYREVYRVLRPGGHFLYTDLFPSAAVAACVEDLRQCGFVVLRDQEITRNVLRSCDRVARARSQAFAAANDATVMADFLGTPGSKTYDDMADGRSTYRIFKLQKPRHVSARRCPPVAFLFPGQGAQVVNMGLGLYQSEPRFRAEVDRCAETLVPHLGLDVRDVLFPRDEPATGSAARLQDTALAQPALFVIEYALARLLMSSGVIPGALLGHSLGEYVAACVAGVFSLDDALALVAARGRIMQAMAPGAMLSVALSEAEVLRRLPDELAVAAVNTASSTVVAGPVAAIDLLASRLDGLGVSHARLETSHAFHSSLMDPAVPQLARQVARYQRNPPALRFASNVTGAWITPEDATDPAYWARHLRATVRFADGLAAVLEDPTQVLLELGPGHALHSFVRKHAMARPGHRVVSVLGDPRYDDRTGIAALVDELGSSQAEVSTESARAPGAEQLRRAPR